MKGPRVRMQSQTLIAKEKKKVLLRNTNQIACQISGKRKTEQVMRPNQRKIHALTKRKMILGRGKSP